jgi:hypothetical protein
MSHTIWFNLKIKYIKINSLVRIIFSVKNTKNVKKKSKKCKKNQKNAIFGFSDFWGKIGLFGRKWDFLDLFLGEF